MSLLAGVAGTVQIAVMGRLGDRIGVVPAFAFAAVVAAGVGLLALVGARHSLAGFADAAHQPAWLWLGGLMGAFVVLPRILGLALLAVGAVLTLKR
jgi:transporter family-2 protein